MDVLVQFSLHTAYAFLRFGFWRSLPKRVYACFWACALMIVVFSYMPQLFFTILNWRFYISMFISFTTVQMWDGILLILALFPMGSDQSFFPIFTGLELWGCDESVLWLACTPPMWDQNHPSFPRPRVFRWSYGGVCLIFGTRPRPIWLGLSLVPFSVTLPSS